MYTNEPEKLVDVVGYDMDGRRVEVGGGHVLGEVG